MFVTSVSVSAALTFAWRLIVSENVVAVSVSRLDVEVLTTSVTDEIVSRSWMPEPLLMMSETLEAVSVRFLTRSRSVVVASLNVVAVSLTRRV